MYYHVKYEDVDDLGEALDLVLTLPQGSLYVSRKWPERSWSEAHELAADIQDCLIECACGLRGVDNAPKVVRPKDIIARRVATEKRRKVRDKLKNTLWEEA